MNLYWKLGILAAYTFAVWQVHTWYDSNRDIKGVEKREEKIATGASTIITENQKITKELANVKDSCLDAKLPSIAY